MEGKTIIAVIVAWVSYMAINKWIWTPMKRGPNPIRKDDNDPASLPSSAAEASSSSSPPPPLPPPEQKDDPASLPSSSAEVSSSPPPHPPPPGQEYDVFLSFRGADTRKGITFELYDRLQRTGIKTFMDDPDLKVGDAISPTLFAAIEQSRFAIVVLSRDYASSTWCLKELAKICECMKEQNRILPLFYHVEPSDVRYQKESFEEAFSKHVGRYPSEKVQQWRDALNKVANFSGWNTQEYKTERELVDKIVDFVYSKVQPIDIEFAMSNGYFELFEATRKARDEVMNALKDDEVTAVGVYGMGGVGKTSMVKRVAAESCKNGTFHHVIMAVVSQSPNFERIQGTLLVELLGPGSELPEFGRASRLYKEIMRKSNILIILDDIWDFIDLPTIGIPIPDRLKERNSKVLLTSRSLHVCNIMDSKAKIQLDILSEEDAWKLFVRNASRPFESPNFYNVARKVAGECGCLPVALIAVARALRDKDEGEWEKAAQRLDKSQSATVEDGEDAFKCIKFSYHYLKEEDSKSCFLLCCLFPEDYDIPIEDLFQYAFGKGLFRDNDTIYEARGIAHSVVKHLKDSSLLLESELSGYVKMHDVVRDTAMRIAKCEDGRGFWVKAGLGLDHRSCPSHGGYSAISLMENKILRLPEQLVGPDLQILLLQKNTDLKEIPERFFQSSNELRLLDLSETSISSLPRSFSLLTNLQALYLDGCKKLIDISIVGKLKKLEILHMMNYPERELSREIGNLTNLRILDVRGFYRVSFTIPSKVISKLHKLEELYMLWCGIVDWGCEIKGQGGETNIGFDELAGLSYLTVLQVCISDAKYIPKNVKAEPNWVYFDIFIGGRIPLSYKPEGHDSKYLHLQGPTISALPHWFNNAVTKKTEKLYYNRCKGMSDILVEYDHGRFHKLKHLSVAGDLFDSYVYLKELMNTTRRVEEGPVFEKLEELHLMTLIHLEELCVGELPPGSFSNLKVLSMFRCKIIKNVSKLVQRLPNLEKLYLKSMRGLEYVFRCEGFQPEQSKLREMYLLGPNSVKSICSGPAPRVMFQSLKSLTFYHCELLQSLFASDVAQCLDQLEDLFVELCPLLERVIEAVNKEKTVLPKLKNLVLMELPMLYGARTTVDIECPLLERLIVGGCPQISFSTYSRFYESRDQFSFSTPASLYFGSNNPVQLNDPQLYDLLRDRKFGYQA